MREFVHRIAVDYSEERSALLDAVRRSGAFDVRLVHLATGDYLINDEVLIERNQLPISLPPWLTGVCFRRLRDSLTAATDHFS
jgi:hypothetical protein